MLPFGVFSSDSRAFPLMANFAQCSVQVLWLLFANSLTQTPCQMFDKVDLFIGCQLTICVSMVAPILFSISPA